VTRLAVAAGLLVSGLALAAVLPGVARAELVPGSAGATEAWLAVAADGSPRVAFVGPGGAVEVAARSGDGVWTVQTAVPAGSPLTLCGLELGRKGAIALVETVNGSTLSLAEQTSTGWRVRRIAAAPTGGQLGRGALTVDRSGRPLVAYVSLRSSRKSYLRLVHEDASGRLVGEAVTRDGFPQSSAPPVAAPVVLRSGAVRVLEAFDGAAIDWQRTKNQKSWTGQFLYANSLATVAGVAQALPNPLGGVWSAWTELFPSAGESELVIALHLDGVHTAVLHRHAFLVGLALGADVPEVAADDYVDLNGRRTVYAGLVIEQDGTTVELAGDLQGYAVDAAGARDYVLVDTAGVSWFRSPTPPTSAVTLAASVAGGSSVTLTGRVTGVSAGSVELWRETASGSTLAATVPLAGDGTFTWTETPPAGVLTYRAVYFDPTTGLPLGSLLRTPLGT